MKRGEHPAQVSPTHAAITRIIHESFIIIPIDEFVPKPDMKVTKVMSPTIEAAIHSVEPMLANVLAGFLDFLLRLGLLLLIQDLTQAHAI
jgi:hypothetical protein